MTDPEQQPLQPDPNQPPLPGMEAIQPLPETAQRAPEEIPIVPMYRPYDHTVGERIFKTMMADADRLMPSGVSPEDYAASLSLKAPGLKIRKVPAKSLDPTEPVQPPQAPEEATVRRDGFKPYPRATSAAATGVGGLKRVFTARGRKEIGDRRRERKEQRGAVANYIARRVLDPRYTPVDPNVPGSAPGDDPTAKLGWVGTGKLSHGGIKTVAGPGNAGAIGGAIMKNPLSPEKAGVGINETRPVTWGEKRDDRKIDRWAEKERVARGQANWLQRSYGEMLDQETGARLAYGEKRLMGKSARRAQKNLRKADKYRGKIKGKIQGDFEDRIEY